MDDVYERPVALTAAQQREQEIARWVERNPRPPINECCASCGPSWRQFSVARLSDGQLAWHCVRCRQPHRPPLLLNPAGEEVAVAPDDPSPVLPPLAPRQVLKACMAELLAGATECEHLIRAVPAAQAEVERAEVALAAAVAARQETAARGAQELEILLREKSGSASARANPDLAAKRRGIENAQDVLDTARTAAALVREREAGARQILERRQQAHRNAALRVLGEEFAPVLVKRAEMQMAEVIANLSALGWLVQQRIALPEGAGKIAELRHCAPQHWPKAAQGTAAASAAMTEALSALLRDPGAKVAIKLS
jgi:hypothetical protein